MAGGRRKVVLIGLAFVVGALIAAGVAGWLTLPGYLKKRIVAEADARGIQLEPGAIQVGFGWATVSDARFRLKGVQGLVGSAKSIEVRLNWLEPKGVLATDVTLDTAGSAGLLALEISTWAKNYPRTLRLPAQAKNIALTWRERVSEKPWLEVAGAEVAPQKGGAVFRAEAATFAGKPLGQIAASWSSDDAVVGLGFGEADPNHAPVRISVEHALTQPRAKIELRPVKAEELAGPLGVEFPIENVTVSGKVQLDLPKTLEVGEVTGTLNVKLDGYVPPHPRELDGIVFGKVTTFDSKLRLNAARTRLELTESKVKAGAFALGGSGVIERAETHATLSLDLSGQLACTTLAGAAAESYLGQTLGKLAGALAKAAMKGSVGVIVKIRADSRKLKEAQVLRTIGIGCGLKPLPLPEIEIAGMKLPKELPTDLSKLPPLPSGLPALPSALPGLPIPKIEVETPAPKPAPKPTPPPSPAPKSS
ncbi:MAG: hypothetical protein R3B13_00525 [Polyangiaceae bacterium]